ncbi:MAG: 23S rRNA (guanosine(2251)-2'-O)-methyltransferase RlmB [Clostridia bacterium]|nr:23S rRNA (guanosine(2251)-2'-O)-methyltransferase RlmB [Oscillospiraceae bacterium]MBO4933244.1 23S rRNA (guanosine(2251)-2'-O)-methyltransferase RlmB [Clostridia bacterium]MBO5128598.1 23S rRNA (guanosine(2251)-2'-O)-methyltransferase RlmB [Clostridia bacterium]MBO5258668.1 23S rRNA (guanosine(2251)-2'-O)-methyltransferase RlmB [Clostridia bacterium]MBP3292609.1 23S rRNA (guanosine(2251)-2'-O)-methyltransferase RlmB [Clostridia bacterium]
MEQKIKKSNNGGRGQRPGDNSRRPGDSRERRSYPERRSAQGGFERRENVVVGRNAVRELLNSETPVDKILVSGREGSVVALIAQAKERKIPVVDADSAALDRLSGGENHQGIAAYVGEKEYSTIEEILETAAERGEKPLIVVCDGIEDPHNLGAVIRCAECAGAHGVIIPERRACGLTPAVSKASAGAILHMKIARVGNIAQTIEKLKENGVWTFAAEAGGMDFYEADFNLPCAIVLGGEDSGVSRLVRERCDFTISIPMFGQVNSLNVSTAASVLLCRAARMQRM